MKNLTKLLGIIALAAVIGFTITACDDGGAFGDNDNNGDNSGDNTGGYTGGNTGGNTGGYTGGGTSVPSAPTGVTATVVSSSSITVSWSSVSGATSYDVYYDSGSDLTKHFAGNVTGTSYTHTGLQAGTYYAYYIKAKNSAGESGYSSYASARTEFSSGGGTSTLSAPTGVSATAASSSSITVSWLSVSSATGYYIYRCSSSSGTYTQVGSSTSNSYTNTGLSASTTYYYKVAAYNSAGIGSQSSYASATTSSTSGGGGTTTKPGIPTSVSASAQSSSSIRISWSAPSSGGTPTWYNILRSTSSSGTYTEIGYATATSYTDTGLNASTTYYYKVEAENSAGTGSQSSYASATTNSSSSGGGGFGTIRLNNDSYSSPIRLTTIVEYPGTVYVSSANEIAVGSYGTFSSVPAGKKYRVNVLISTSTSYNSDWFDVYANQTVTMRFTGTGLVVQ